MTKINWKKIKIISTSIFISLVLFLFAFEGYILTVGYKERTAPLPDNYGNFEHVRALLADDKKTEEISFAVVGDTRSFGTFEKICGQLADEPLSLMVILGDFVQKGTFGEHQFYRCEIGEPHLFSFPVFYLVGNHEIGKGVTLNDFEKIYGPSNFSFSYQGHLFILLRTWPPDSTKESLEFLEHELSTKRRVHDKVFVFSHIPLYASSDFPARPLENAKMFVELFEKYHVDYVFAGDYHGYARVKVNNVNYIVTGGGGARLKYANKYGNFHHAIVMKVQSDAISERILSVEEHKDLEDKIEHLAIAEVSPWIMQHKLASVLFNLLGFAVLVLAFFLLKKGLNESA
jgi:hypothetical protein